jgi:predicted transcriptional regulator
MKVEQALRLEEWERAKHARDFQQSDGLHPMTDGWAKYHPDQRRVPVRNPEGRIVMLTPGQHTLMVAVRQLEGRKVSATIIAASLGVATSTVTRGLVILAMLKLVAYDVETGRNGGFTFLSMAWADLKRRSRTALERVRHWQDQAHSRFERRLERSGWFVAGLNFASREDMDATFSEAT